MPHRGKARRKSDWDVWRIYIRPHDCRLYRVPLGVFNHTPSSRGDLAAQYFIALSVGVKYVGITARELRRDVVAAIGLCAILICLTFIVVEGVLILGLAPPIERSWP